jgi:tagatose 6-phosphate kinase
MIGVVCLNLALDITHHVPVVDWSGVNRPTAVEARPGGKGVNVARTLLALGAGVRVLGLAGGATGAAVRSGLDELGVPSELTPVAGETRRTFAVLDQARGTTALFNEPGPTVAATEFAAFHEIFERLLVRAQVMVMSGSLPPGLAAGTYATLITRARAAGVPTVLDAHGDALRLGVAAGPAIVKPNRDELADLGGHPAITEAARDLRAAGAEAVVASLGPDGLLAATPDGGWRAVPPPVEAVNPTGAGDAVVAGLTFGLATGQPWPDRLRDAAALGTATVLAPVAGEYDPAEYRRLRAGVTVEGGGG